MATKQFFQEIRDEISAIFNPTSPLVISKTVTVPNVEDAGFTLAAGEEQKAKTIETCVLFIDIRNSTQLNFKHSNDELAKLYSAFIKSMLRAAEFYNGYVRNINGDRIMVVFDVENCFLNAVKTATLLHTVSTNLIDLYFKGDDFKCGIGIDYGSMLVVKTGTIKKGKENQFYKSFVWLGKPANLASKLTDLANKENYFIRITRRIPTILLRFVAGRPSDVFGHDDRAQDIDISEFADKLTKVSEADEVKYDTKKALFWSKVKTTKHPVLMTHEVYQGLLKSSPTSPFVTDHIKPSSVKVKGYNNKVYGMNAYYPAVKETK